MPSYSSDELKAIFSPKLHWVPGIAPYRLALSPLPGKVIPVQEHVALWQRAGVQVVLSLLEPHEVSKLGVASEPTLCAAHGMAFLSLPIPDHGTPPSIDAVATMVDTVHAHLLQAQAVAIHCHAGIGRTGIVAGCVLHLLKVPQPKILPLLRQARGFDMPQWDAQIEWIETFIRRRQAPKKLNQT